MNALYGLLKCKLQQILTTGLKKIWVKITKLNCFPIIIYKVQTAISEYSAHLALIIYIFKTFCRILQSNFIESNEKNRKIHMSLAKVDRKRGTDRRRERK